MAVSMDWLRPAISCHNVSSSHTITSSPSSSIPPSRALDLKQPAISNSSIPSQPKPAMNTKRSGQNVFLPVCF